MVALMHSMLWASSTAFVPRLSPPTPFAAPVSSSWSASSSISRELDHAPRPAGREVRMMAGPVSKLEVEPGEGNNDTRYQRKRHLTTSLDTPPTPRSAE